MRDDNCIFCKIANGDIPSYTVYEDETFRVFLDAAPANKGHCLVVPKAHYKDFYELPGDTAAKAICLAQKIAKKVAEKTGCDGLNIIQNNGEAAGQTVMHYHMHIIPRVKDDGHLVPWKPLTVTEEEQKKTLELLKD